LGRGLLACSPEVWDAAGRERSLRSKILPLSIAYHLILQILDS
jgi:hypothetical protein